MVEPRPVHRREDEGQRPPDDDATDEDGEQQGGAFEVHGMTQPTSALRPQFKRSPSTRMWRAALQPLHRGALARREHEAMSRWIVTRAETRAVEAAVDGGEKRLDVAGAHQVHR